MIVKIIEVDKTIRKAETLKQKYNELNQVQSKGHNDFKVLKIDHNWLNDMMKVINVQQENIFASLENICNQQQKQLANVNMELENYTNELHVQIQKLKGKLKIMCHSPGKTFQITYINNRMKEFEKLLVDNVLFKVQNQVLINKKTRSESNGGR